MEPLLLGAWCQRMNQSGWATMASCTMPAYGTAAVIRYSRMQGARELCLGGERKGVLVLKLLRAAVDAGHAPGWWGGWEVKRY